MGLAAPRGGELLLLWLGFWRLGWIQLGHHPIKGIVGLIRLDFAGSLLEASGLIIAADCWPRQKVVQGSLVLACISSMESLQN